MATGNSNISTDISGLQRRMAQVRHEMHQDVQGAVKGAQSLTDWRSLVRSQPWLALGVAAAAGYLIVPKRRRETPTAVAARATPAQVAPAAPPNQPVQARRAESSMMGTVFGLLVPVAVRAAQNYALKRFEEWLERSPLKSAGITHRRPYDSDAGPAATTGAPARVHGVR